VLVRLVGRYDIVKKLAEGGFGITFLGRDIMQPSQPLCVIKQLWPHQASEPRIRQFFNDEAVVLERLGKHSQIPQLLSYFTETQNYYIVQEYIDGQDLSCEIETGKRLSDRTGRSYRLPSEAEWEYAVELGQRRRFILVRPCQRM